MLPEGSKKGRPGLHGPDGLPLHLSQLGVGVIFLPCFFGAVASA